MNLLEMSISASVMVIIVLLVRFFGKKHFSKTVIITLWNLILIRALVPFQIPLGNMPLWKQEDGGTVFSKIAIPRYEIGQISTAGLAKTTEKLGNPLQIE